MLCFIECLDGFLDLVVIPKLSVNLRNFNRVLLFLISVASTADLACSSAQLWHQSLFFTDEDHRKEFFIEKVATQFYPFDVHAGTDRTDGVKRHPECYCDRVYALFSLTAEQRTKLQAMSYLAL